MERKWKISIILIVLLFVTGTFFSRYNVNAIENDDVNITESKDESDEKSDNKTMENENSDKQENENQEADQPIENGERAVDSNDNTNDKVNLNVRYTKLVEGKEYVLTATLLEEVDGTYKKVENIDDVVEKFVAGENGEGIIHLTFNGLKAKENKKYKIDYKLEQVAEKEFIGDAKTAIEEFKKEYERFSELVEDIGSFIEFKDQDKINNLLLDLTESWEKDKEVYGDKFDPNVVYYLNPLLSEFEDLIVVKDKEKANEFINLIESFNKKEDILTKVYNMGELGIEPEQLGLTKDDTFWGSPYYLGMFKGHEWVYLKMSKEQVHFLGTISFIIKGKENPKDKEEPKEKEQPKKNNEKEKPKKSEKKSKTPKTIDDRNILGYMVIFSISLSMVAITFMKKYNILRK